MVGTNIVEDDRIVREDDVRKLGEGIVKKRTEQKKNKIQ